MNEVFHHFARKVSQVSGDAITFFVAIVVIVGWLITGPAFRYSDTWQLIINTSTTIVTFLMVFVLQNTQNRDNQAVQLKLDELLRSVRSARNSFMDIENLPDKDLTEMAEEFKALHERAQHVREQRAAKSGQG